MERSWFNVLCIITRFPILWINLFSKIFSWKELYSAKSSWEQKLPTLRTLGAICSTSKSLCLVLSMSKIFVDGSLPPFLWVSILWNIYLNRSFCLSSYDNEVKLSLNACIELTSSLKKVYNSSKFSINSKGVLLL